MKTDRMKWLSLLVMILTTLFFISCNDSNDTEKTSTLTVKLADSPGDFDEVNIEVLDVMVKNNADTGDGGWISIGTAAPHVYNLLELTGGLNVVLADNAIIPSGNLGQIRLLLGNDNTVVKDGITYPLNTPSAQQSGLKLAVNTTLQPDTAYDFMLDFDVEKSIVVQAGGSGNYNLNPVIRVITTANTGSIKGTVVTVPANLQVLASANVGGIVVSAYTDTEGKFQLNGIPAGTYTVTLTPDIASELPMLAIENVVVVNGQVTDIGSHTIE